MRGAPLCWFPWQLMSQPDFSFPCNCNLSLPWEQRLLPCPACRLPHMVGCHSRPCLRHGRSPSFKALMSLSLTLGSFFSLETGQVLGLKACGVQPNTCRLCNLTDFGVFLGNASLSWNIMSSDYSHPSHCSGPTSSDTSRVSSIPRLLSDHHTSNVLIM